jgi:hypothetical protein
MKLDSCLYDICNSELLLQLDPAILILSPRTPCITQKVTETRVLRQTGYNMAKLPGTQGNHKLCPSTHMIWYICHQVKKIMISKCHMLLLHMTVTCTWGCSNACDNDKCDILVKCMDRRLQDTLTLIFSWPQNENKCHIGFAHVLCTVPVPLLCGRNGQHYRLEHAVTYLVSKNFLQLVEKRSIQCNCMHTGC